MLVQKAPDSILELHFVLESKIHRYLPSFRFQVTCCKVKKNSISQANFTNSPSHMKFLDLLGLGLLMKNIRSFYSFGLHGLPACQRALLITLASELNNYVTLSG